MAFDGLNAARGALFKHAVYPLVDGVFRRNTFRAYRDITRLETLDREQLARYQVEQVRGLLARSRAAVPYYADLLRDIDLHESAFTSIRDLEQIPLLTKALVRARGTDLLSS